MTWTAPRTWVTAEVPTATIMNAHIRDNVIALQWKTDVVITLESTSSTAYVNLTTTGPTVSVNSLTRAYVFTSCQTNITVAPTYGKMSYAVSNATTIAAADGWAVVGPNTANGLDSNGVMSVQSALTAGVNTFTAKYASSSGTSQFTRRRMAVLAVGP